MSSPIPREYAGLVDDAAIFPPGNAPLDRAWIEHREHRHQEYAPLLGPLVVDDVRLPALIDLVSAAGPLSPPLPVTVVVTGGAGGLLPAARWVGAGAPGRRQQLELRGLEVALRDLDDLPGNARRVAAAAYDVSALAPEVAVYVEVRLPVGGSGLSAGWLAAADEVAAADLRLKVRTGGPDPVLFPPSPVLAGAVEAALDRELAFKCTAGLHSAVRHREAGADGTPALERHGFLNVLLATRAALDGEDVEEALDRSDPDVVVGRLRDLGTERLVSARSWFTSFGCCGVLDPLTELRTLGLVAC